MALFFSDLYADFLAPLFDSITILDEVLTSMRILTFVQTNDRESQLKAQIKVLSERLGVPMSEVFKISSSGHTTNHSNAY